MTLAALTPNRHRATLIAMLSLLAALAVGAAFLVQQAKAAIAFKAPEEIISAGQNGTPSDFKWPTSLAIDPLGRLVVATQCGGIYVFNNPSNPTFAFKITSIENHPNKNFNGSPKPSIASFNGCYDASKGGKARQTTGITFGPALEGGNPVMYVSHSDPEIFVNKPIGQNTIYPASGVVSKLSGANYGTKTDLVTGLARSGENHGPNGMDIGPDGWLYLAIGGNTNHGGKSVFFSWWPETHHSAAVVKINPAAIGNQTIDVSSYNEFTYSNPGANPPVVSLGQPKGSTLNANVPGKFELYSTGFRNPYDIVWHSNGSAYINENEGNGGFGVELLNGEDGCSAGNNGNDPGTPLDELHKLSQGSFHGHPNASRNECLRNQKTAGSVTGAYVPAVYTYSGAATKRSIVGIDEYKTPTPIFDGGEMQGQLVYASFSVTDAIWRLSLDAQGKGIIGSDTKIADIPAALDVHVAPNGTIFAASRNNPAVDGGEAGVGGAIYKIEPVNLANCPLPGNPQVNDSDSDGFTDGAEQAAGTGICNPADFPADVDKDGIPDAVDPDDDNDGVLDTADQLQLDPTNGSGTKLPFKLEFNATQAGGFFGTGFPGVQLSSNGGGPLNGKVSGGAAGGFLGYTSTAGTNRAGQNNQNNAMQIGFPGQKTATVSALLGQPYLTDLSDEDGKPEGEESGGVYIGPDEDNFVSVGVNATNGSPVIELITEVNGAYNKRATAPLSLPVKEVTFSLKTDTANATVEGLFRIEGAEQQSLGKVSVPKAWLGTPTLAGVFGTSVGSNEEQAFVFDDFEVSGTGGGTTVDTSNCRFQQGTDGREVLRGDANCDRIHASGGDDWLYGEGSIDFLRGENGRDQIRGGAGGDQIWGGRGINRIYGGFGNDRIWGGRQQDRVWGGPGNDQIRAGVGKDIVYGNNGNDLIKGYNQDDNLSGGPGNDKVYGQSGKDIVKGNAGNDRLRGGSNQDKLYGGTGKDRLHGGAGADLLVGGPGNDIIIARDKRRDRVLCGPGNDIVIADPVDVLIGCERRRS